MFLLCVVDQLHCYYLHKRKYVLIKLVYVKNWDEMVMAPPLYMYIVPHTFASSRWRSQRIRLLRFDALLKLEYNKSCHLSNENKSSH